MNDDALKAEFSAFVGMVLKAAPERASGEAITRLCARLMLTYASHPEEALAWLNIMRDVMRGVIVEAIARGELEPFYDTSDQDDPADDECMCDACVAHRRAHSH